MSFLVNPYVYGGCDPDAVAFLTAAGITDPTITSAVCTLVTSMKANGTWAKCNAIYPFVGGSATTHKFNLKNPADTNAAFRLTFIGGITHSSNGVAFNGTNSYANTFLIPNSGLLTLHNTHLSYYSRTDINQSSIDMGSYNTTVGGNNLFGLAIRKSPSAASSFQYDQGVATSSARNLVLTDTRGFFMSNRTSNVASTHKLFRNGASVGTATTTAGAFRPDGITIGAVFTGFYSSKQCAFASIGSGFSDAEAATLYSDVQAFQTTLSRNV
jgi:hypothetical protein